MGRVNQVKLPNNTTYDIYGKNVVDISYDDYQNLSEEQKNADIAYHIYDVPEDQAEPTKTASGAIASFDDGGNNKPLKSLKLAINPVQDLHGYDRPWAGGAGKNIIGVSETTLAKPSYYPDNWTGTTVAGGENAITVTRSNGQGGFGGVQILDGLKAGTYTFSVNVPVTSDKKVFFYGYSQNGAYVKQKSLGSINANEVRAVFTFTLEDDTDGFYIKMTVQKASDVPLTFTNIQVEKGSTATSYEPYSNICPISGWTGANVQRCGSNLFNENFSDYSESTAYLYYGSLPKNQALNISFEDKDTSIDVSGINIGFAYDYTSGGLTNYRWSLNNGVVSSNLTNVTNRGDYGNTIVIYPKDEATFNKLKARYNIKISIGSDAERYEPYNGTTYPITWSNAGEVFGGYIDYERKKVIVTWAKVMLGDLTWAKNTTYGYFYTYGVNNSIKHYESARTEPLLCNIYGDCTDGSSYEQVPDGTIYNAKISTTYCVCIKDSAYADSTSLKEALTSLGAYLVYKLETPIEYDLDEPLPTIKTLLGNNNIRSDTGDVLECVYVPSLLTQIRYNDKVYATPAYTPKAGDANTVSGHTVKKDVPSDAVFTDTTYESKTAVQSGTDVSLVTTGEKWGWNNKSDLSTIAPPYDPLKSYKYGNFTSYDNMLYSCISPTTGTWDSTKWRSVTVGEILTNLRGVIAPVADIDAVADMVQKDELLDVLDYGDQLVMPWFDGTTEYELPFNFCHLEIVKDENDNDVKVADFEAEYVLPTDCIFDAAEAIYASDTDLAAGDYYFKIVNDSWGNNNDKYICFTLDATLTAGKQIRKKSGAYNAAIENCTLGIYTDGTDTAGTALSFTVETTEPSIGTSLGQTDGSGDLNHWHCVVLGYNRYKYSAVRQYLNADAVKNTWWVQQHKWDVMPAYATTKDGFLYGLSADVKARLKTTKIATARNTVFNSGDTPIGDMDITYDKVFLIGLEQSYISPQVEGEGETWEYYKLLNGTSTPYQRSSTYADLIKYGVDAKKTARDRWLRSCFRGNANNEWNVNSSGNVNNNNANNANRVAPLIV